MKYFIVFQFYLLVKMKKYEHFKYIFTLKIFGEVFSAVSETNVSGVKKNCIGTVKV